MALREASQSVESHGEDVVARPRSSSQLEVETAEENEEALTMVSGLGHVPLRTVITQVHVRTLWTMPEEQSCWKR